MSRLQRTGFSILLALISLPLLAQFRASVQGTVTDPTGGVIPRAHIKLENQGTQASQETNANDQGFYRFNQIQAGSYTITVDAQGFQPFTVRDVRVAADLPQTVDTTLQAGNIESYIT